MGRVTNIIAAELKKGKALEKAPPTVRFAPPSPPLPSKLGKDPGWPHNGQSCSVKCAVHIRPCVHLDCTHCVSVSTGTSKIPPQNDQTMISRVALAGLCAKAGIEMEWNSGHPIFRDSGYTPQREQAYRDAEKAAITEKLRQIDAKNGARLTGASEAFNKTIVDQVMSRMEDNLRAGTIFTARPQQVEGTFVANGASDDDVAAAEKLLGWNAPGGDDDAKAKPEKVEWWDDPSVRWSQKADMKAYLDRIDKELATVLSEVLAGK